MKLKKHVLIVASVLCLSVLPSSARLHETLQQCIERYGKPLKVSEDGKSVDFLKSDIALAIDFVDGKADNIFFIKITKEGVTAPLTDEEVSILLQANGGGKEWQKRTDRTLYAGQVIDKQTSELVTSDGSAFASLDLKKKTLSVHTAAYEARLKKAADDEIKKLFQKPEDKLKGF
jgi:hypothetical protein